MKNLRKEIQLLMMINKMKRTVLFVVLVLFSTNVAAQESIFDDINLNVLEQLIELAKQNYPERQIYKQQENVSDLEVKASKWAYLDFVNVNFFYRPQDRSTINPENPYIVNGGQVGVSFNPGNYLQKPFQVKRAKAEREIAKLESEAFDTALANQVKGAYYDYVFSLNEITTGTQAAQDADAFLEDARLKFERGEIQIAEYTDARDARLSANSALKRAEVAYLKAKDALEALVGVDLSTIDSK